MASELRLSALRWHLFISGQNPFRLKNCKHSINFIVAVIVLLAEHFDELSILKLDQAFFFRLFLGGKYPPLIVNCAHSVICAIKARLHLGESSFPACVMAVVLCHAFIIAFPCDGLLCARLAGSHKAILSSPPLPVSATGRCAYLLTGTPSGGKMLAWLVNPD